MAFASNQWAPVIIFANVLLAIQVCTVGLFDAPSDGIDNSDTHSGVCRSMVKIIISLFPHLWVIL
jgi:hypothetical protein